MMKNTFCNGLFYWTGVRFSLVLGKRVLFFDTTSVVIKQLWKKFIFHTQDNFNTTSVLIKSSYLRHFCFPLYLVFP